MTLNMLFVPGHLRLAYINVVSLAWTSILSRMAAAQPTLPNPEACVLDVDHVYDSLTDPVIQQFGTAWEDAG